MTLADFFAIPQSIDVEVPGDESQKLHPISAKGLKIRPPSQVEQGQFSRYLEGRAREFAERSATDEQRAEYRRLAIVEGAGGVYDWGSDAYTLALKRPVTLAKMLQFILQGANASLANCPEDAERIALQIVTQRIAELAAIIGASETDDPDKKKAILEAVGLPPTFLDSANGSDESTNSPSPVPSPSAAESTSSAS